MPRPETKITPAPLWPYPAFAPFLPWTPVQPSLYWNTESPERGLLELCRNLEKLIQYAEGIGINVNELRAFYDELASRMESLEEDFADEFADYYKNNICEWVNTHLDCIVGNAVRFVQFGMDEDGHLIAMIPNNWDFLQFKTDNDADSPEYGKLQIVY